MASGDAINLFGEFEGRGPVLVATCRTFPSSANRGVSRMPCLDLVPLGPVDGHGSDAALRHGESIVAILNDDARQPDAVKGSPGQDRLTVEQFLAETAAWCGRNSAQSYAIVRGDACIGMISMSHIDDAKKCARCGWIVASEVWGQGLEEEAVRQVIEMARARGLKTLGGKMAKDNSKAVGFWQTLGARIEESGEPSHWLAIVDIANEIAL